MTTPDETRLDPDYPLLHAAVVDAIRAHQNHDDAAHEALERLRDVGVPIPPRGSPDDYLP